MSLSQETNNGLQLPINSVQIKPGIQLKSYFKSLFIHNSMTGAKLPAFDLTQSQNIIALGSFKGSAAYINDFCQKLSKFHTVQVAKTQGRTFLGVIISRKGTLLYDY